MNIGIDIDGTLTRYPQFFWELGRLWRRAGHRVYIITGLGHRSAVEKLAAFSPPEGEPFYDELIDTSQYDTAERAMIGKVAHNEIVVGHFKARICRERGVAVMFDDQAAIHRHCGNPAIFEVK